MAATQQGKNGAPERKRRRDAGQARVTERDLRLLAWVGQQYALRFDHLQYMEGLSYHAATWVLRRWERAGWAEYAPIIAREPRWVWLTRSGVQLVNLGYARWEPTPGKLAHIQAVNTVRLHLETEHPDGTWTCERTLRLDYQWAEAGTEQPPLPDGVWQAGPDAAPVAVEVQRSYQGRSVTQAKVAKLQEHYDTIWWFAPPPVYYHLERLTTEAQWEQVRVLPLPALAERTET
jgi:hypothetical protein